MKRKCTQRTDEELKKASEHIAYEFEQLTFLSRQLRMSDSGLPIEMRSRGEQLYYFGMLTTFATHARNLYVFLLFRPNDMCSDMFAIDYLGNSQAVIWEQRQEIHKKAASLDDLFNRASKLVAHLSYLRDDKNIERRWDYLTIQHDLTTALKEFIALVPDHRLINDLIHMKETGVLGGW